MPHYDSDLYLFSPPPHLYLRLPCAQTMAPEKHSEMNNAL